MAAGAGRSRPEADPARCRRHPKHRHDAGVCPFCLRDRLSRLSAAAAAAAGANASAASRSSSSGGSSSSSPYSSWEETVAVSSGQVAPRPRRGSLGLLLRQEGREAAAALAAGRRAEQTQEEERTATAKRGGNFWARLQQQLHHGGGRHSRKDGCFAVAADKHGGAAVASHKRPLVA
ncbi:unnamed protein product [Urochloa humidicola]